MLHPHLTTAFKDPWKQRHAWFLREDFTPADLLENGHVRWSRNKLTDAQKAKYRQDAQELREAGQKSFKGADHAISPEVIERKDSMVADLQKFEAATGISQADTIQKIEACKSEPGLDKITRALQKSGLEYVRDNLIEKNSIFKLKDGLEELDAPSKKSARAHYLNWAKSLPLFAEPGEDSLASFIENFPKFVEPEEEFQRELDKQTPFIQQLFYQKLNEAKVKKGLRASAPEVWKELQEEMGEVMKAPQPAQVELKKLAKSRKPVSERIREVMEGLNGRLGKYAGLLKDNMKLFGGKMVQTPQGPMREAAKEFYDWMQKRANFADMDTNIDLFEKVVIPQRTAVYNHRDELLANLPEPTRDSLQKKTDLMRFHSLQAYVKDLEKISQKGSTYALEYTADVEGTMFENMNVFNDEERATYKARILVQLPERQEGELERLHSVDIAERLALFEEYSKLPTHLKDDADFANANIFDKKKYLTSARKTQEEGKQNPFALKTSPAGNNRKKQDHLALTLQSQEGRDYLKEQIEKEDVGQRLQNLAEITNRMGTTWEEIEQQGITQLEHRMKKDAAYGLRGRDKDIFKVGFGIRQAASEEEQYFGETFVTDTLWRLSGEDRQSGGHIVEGGLQVIDQQAWLNGEDSAVNALDATPWDEMAMFTNAEGKDELHLTQKNRKAFEAMFHLLAKILQKDLGLEGSGEQVMGALNSAILEADHSFADAAKFNQLNVPANSTDYSNEAAA